MQPAMRAALRNSSGLSSAVLFSSNKFVRSIEISHILGCAIERRDLRKALETTTLPPPAADAKPHSKSKRKRTAAANSATRPPRLIKIKQFFTPYEFLDDRGELVRLNDPSARFCLDAGISTGSKPARSKSPETQTPAEEIETPNEVRVTLGEPVGDIMSWWTTDLPEPRRSNSCRNPNIVCDGERVTTSYCASCAELFLKPRKPNAPLSIPALKASNARRSIQHASVRSRNMETMRNVSARMLVAAE